MWSVLKIDLKKFSENYQENTSGGVCSSVTFNTEGSSNFTDYGIQYSPENFRKYSYEIISGLAD